MAVSPFERNPRRPAGDLELPPLVVLTAVAVAPTAAGLVGPARRDIG